MSGNGSTLATPGQFLHAFGYPRSDSADFANAVSATPPTPVFPGKLWWNTNDGQLYVWYVDPNSAQWVAIQASQGGAAPFQVGPGLSLNVGTSPPTIDVVTPYLALSGGAMTGAITSGLAVRGGLIVGATGNIPAAGNITLNQNTVTPFATYAGSGFRVIGADGQVSGMVAETYGAAPPVIAGRNAGNTGASPAPVTATSLLLRMQGIGYAGGATYTAASTIDFYANETWTTSNSGSGLRLWSTPNGANTAVTSLQLQGQAARLSGGLVVGAGNAPATADPGPGAVTINANTVAPPALLAGEPNNLWVVGTDSNNTGITIEGRGGSPIVAGRAARGTLATPTATQSLDPLFSIHAIGYGTSFAFGAFISALASENWTAGAHGSLIQFQTIPAGTTSAIVSLQLQGNAATFASGGTNVGYISIAGPPGPVNGASNWPFIYGDSANMVFHLGSGNSAFGFQNQAGAGLFNISSVGVLPNGGYQTKAGNVGMGGADGHAFNISWGTGGPAHLWVDATDQGSINVTPCDVRLKKNLEPPTVDALAAINAVELKQFDWLEDDLRPERHEDIGFIAQQLVECIPNAVTLHDDPEQMASVQLTPIVAHLIGAVQQLSAEVAALKAQLAQLGA